MRQVKNHIGKTRAAPTRAANRRAAKTRQTSADVDDEPTDMDELRYKLARRLEMLINDWHGCPEPACKRQRRCAAPHILCSNRRTDLPQATPEQFGRFMAEMQRVLRAAMEQEEGRESEPAPAKRRTVGEERMRDAVIPGRGAAP